MTLEFEPLPPDPPPGTPDRRPQVRTAGTHSGTGPGESVARARPPTFPRSLGISIALHALVLLVAAWHLGSAPVRRAEETVFRLRLDPPAPSDEPEAEPGGDEAHTETPDASDASEAMSPDDWTSDATDAAAEAPEPAVGDTPFDRAAGLAEGGPATKLAREAWHGRLGGRERLLREGGGDETTEGAVRRALAWLARHQAADGTWSATTYTDRCRDLACDGRGQKDYVEATTALALLPFLGAGNTPSEGPWRDTVGRGVRALVERQKADGSWGFDPRSAYASAIATLAIAEAYGMTGAPPLREPAQRAVDYWVRTQAPSGGWRYQPGDGEADSSVTGWVTTALAGARRAGLDVPPRTLLGCRAWFHGRTSEEGRVGYTGPGSGSVALLGTGLFAQALTGADPAGPRVAATARLLASNLPRRSSGRRDDNSGEFGASDPIHWFYGGLAAFQHGGDLWTVWELRLRDVLLPTQAGDADADGSWPPLGATGRSGGRVVTTALCCLALEVYYRYPRTATWGR